MVNDDFQQIYVELIQILNEWDPIGVLPFAGGPKDEYGCFLGPITTILEKNKGKEELQKFLLLKCLIITYLITI